MDISSTLPAFVVTLREGVEAALVVGIVLAYLKKAQQSQLNAWVYSGIGAGVLTSILVGTFLAWTIAQLEGASQQYAPVFKPSLVAVFSALAIGLLSWMLIWMTQQSRLLKAEVERTIGTTLQQGNGAGWGVFGLIFFAVVREGFETVLFLASQVQGGVGSVIGAGTGLLGAIGIGFLLFQVGIKINLKRFFQVMGVLLLLIVGGLVLSALGNTDRALTALTQIHPEWAFLCLLHDPLVRESSCILGPLVWNTQVFLPDRQFPGILLKTLIGYRDHLYLVQVIGYGIFWLTIGVAYFRSLGGAIVQSPQTPVATK
ncbi:MAG: FTR1 family protein [Leptolyngbyaceae cyanobacterium bins.59]|nr:FTR1 family protein [Leptolyngbyaceae cyanobacterium bins.59]